MFLLCFFPDLTMFANPLILLHYYFKFATVFIWVRKSNFNTLITDATYTPKLGVTPSFIALLFSICNTNSNQKKYFQYPNKYQTKCVALLQHFKKHFTKTANDLEMYCKYFNSRTYARVSENVSI